MGHVILRRKSCNTMRLTAVQSVSTSHRKKTEAVSQSQSANSCSPMTNASPRAKSLCPLAEAHVTQTQLYSATHHTLKPTATVANPPKWENERSPPCVPEESGAPSRFR